MPTPPFNHPSAIDAFAPTIARYKGETVQDLDAPRRERNRALLMKRRKSGKCEFPECDSYRCGYVDPHHIKTRGSGGGDTDENVIGLCRKHHDAAHAGRISKPVLLAIVAGRK